MCVWCFFFFAGDNVLLCCVAVKSWQMFAFVGEKFYIIKINPNQYLPGVLTLHKPRNSVGRSVVATKNSGTSIELNFICATNFFSTPTGLIQLVIVVLFGRAFTHVCVKFTADTRSAPLHFVKTENQLKTVPLFYRNASLDLTRQRQFYSMFLWRKVGNSWFSFIRRQWTRKCYVVWLALSQNRQTKMSFTR